MPDRELKQQSQVILNALGKSFAEIFNVDGDEDAAMLALLERLDDLDIPREIVLDSANERVERLLSNTANQSHQ